MARKFVLPRIYPITDRIISGLSHPEQVSKLIEGGAELIQIRDKSATSRALYGSVVECLEIAGIAGVRLIVNDRVDIALVSKANGVHLGQDDLPAVDARRLLGEDAIIGLSTHSLTQAREAVKHPVNYIAYGPIFATVSKPDHEIVVGLDGLRQIRDEIGDFPLVAIGGIGPENLSAVLEAGADCAAMIGALISEPQAIAKKTKQAIRLSI